MGTGYNKKIHMLLMRKAKGKYPEKRHYYTSEKFGGYVYCISINGVQLWEAVMQDIPPGSCWTWHYYAKTEDRCAKEVNKIILRYYNRVKKDNKRSGGHFIRHKIWDKWIKNYNRKVLIK